MEEIGFKQSLPTTIHEDNQGCVAIAKYPKINARTKHINIKFHYVRELVDNKVISVVYCNTKSMTADIMTKPLSNDLFLKFRNELGISSNTVSN